MEAQEEEKDEDKQPKEEQKIDSAATLPPRTGKAYFLEELEKAMDQGPWTNANKKMVTGCSATFTKHHQGLILLANKLLDRGETDKIQTVLDFPYLAEAENPEELLLAILIQNCYHAQNAKRIAAVQEGQYIGILSNKKA